MARKPDIRYICYYTDGSAARQLEVKTPTRRRAPVMKPRKQKKIVLRIDPVAVGGLLLSTVMLVMMLVGGIQLYTLRQQAQQMRDYVTYLSEQNTSLTEVYESGYDLEAVKKSALALGMIPLEEAQNITISVEVPPAPVQQEQNIGMWERMSAFIVDLFA